MARTRTPFPPELLEYLKHHAHTPDEVRRIQKWRRIRDRLLIALVSIAAFGIAVWLGG